MSDDEITTLPDQPAGAGQASDAPGDTSTEPAQPAEPATSPDQPGATGDYPELPDLVTIIGLLPLTRGNITIPAGQPVDLPRDIARTLVDLRRAVYADEPTQEG